jgi:hypothetical protein
MSTPDPGAISPSPSSLTFPRGEPAPDLKTSKPKLSDDLDVDIEKADSDVTPSHTLRVLDGEQPTGLNQTSLSSADGDPNSHYAKLFKLHGRVDLEPMPSDSPADPLNWPKWKKEVLLWIVAVHTALGPFSAGQLFLFLEKRNITYRC